MGCNFFLGDVFVGKTSALQKTSKQFHPKSGPKPRHGCHVGLDFRGGGFGVRRLPGATHGLQPADVAARRLPRRTRDFVGFVGKKTSGNTQK